MNKLSWFHLPPSPPLLFRWCTFTGQFPGHLSSLFYLALKWMALALDKRKGLEYTLWKWPGTREKKGSSSGVLYGCAGGAFLSFPSIDSGHYETVGWRFSPFVIVLWMAQCISVTTFHYRDIFFKLDGKQFWSGQQGERRRRRPRRRRSSSMGIQ